MGLEHHAGIALLALAGLAGCAEHQAAYGLPAGLTYRCDGQPAMIAYNGQGYLPGNSARMPYLGAEGAQQPRATAQLSFGGRQFAMMADWAESGLRYRSIEPHSDTHALVWTAAGETAVVSEIPVRQGAGERRLAECVRVREVSGAAAHGGAASAPQEQPHRR